MNLYKLYNKSNEEISFKVNKENIINTNTYSRNGVTFGIDKLNEVDTRLDSIISNIDNGLYDIAIATPIDFVKGSTYNRGTIVRYNGQMFMATPKNKRTTRMKPQMYCSDWIAITDQVTPKQIGIDMAKSDTVRKVNEDEFGGLLFKLPEILFSGNYYDYFMDGDHFTLIGNDDIMYNMRIEYREWYNYQTEELYIRVDAISDELIPTIRLNVNNTMESPRLSAVATSKNVSIKDILYGAYNQLTNYYNTNFTDQEITKAYGELNGCKYGSEKLYIKTKDAYIYNISELRYLAVDDVFDSVPCYNIGHIWLPNEKEIFGKKYNSLTNYSETQFNQYSILDSAYKRVKTVDGVPKPWITSSIFKPTSHPIVVDEYGNEVPIDLCNNNYNKDVYLPLCITLATYVKK